MDECMKMPGGGPWRLYSGQITDDSDIQYAKIDGVDVSFDENAGNNEFSITLNIAGKESISVEIADV